MGTRLARSARESPPWRPPSSCVVSLEVRGCRIKGRYRLALAAMPMLIISPPAEHRTKLFLG